MLIRQYMYCIAQRFTEYGLPGILFSILDHELDVGLTSNIHDTLTSIMQSMAAENLTAWLSLLREVLTVANADAAEAEGDKGGGGGGGGADKAKSNDDDDEDDAAGDDDEFTSGEEARDSIQPRWQTRVFGAECLRRVSSSIPTDIITAHVCVPYWYNGLRLKMSCPPSIPSTDALSRTVARVTGHTTTSVWPERSNARQGEAAATAASAADPGTTWCSTSRSWSGSRSWRQRVTLIH